MPGFRCGWDGSPHTLGSSTHHTPPHHRRGSLTCPASATPAPQPVVALAPGESGYASVSLSATDGSGTNGHTEKALTVSFQGRTEGETLPRPPTRHGTRQPQLPPRQDNSRSSDDGDA
ncbi:DUF4232 domain-containing protein [Streptomyces sp. NPDC048483]|uniref:DUF4232 domain-containing protein n=1 Tax=Streptomyces sp. NPDC048483 TaxID=3154927 RepID=UPI003428837C